MQKEYIWNLFCQTGNIDFYILYKNYDNIEKIDLKSYQNEVKKDNFVLR